MRDKVLSQAAAVVAYILLVSVDPISCARKDSDLDERAPPGTSGSVVPIQPAEYLDCGSIRRPADNGIASRSTAEVEPVPEVHLASFNSVPINVEQIGRGDACRTATYTGGATLLAVETDVVAKGIKRRGPVGRPASAQALELRLQTPHVADVGASPQKYWVQSAVVLHRHASCSSLDSGLVWRGHVGSSAIDASPVAQRILPPNVL